MSVNVLVDILKKTDHTVRIKLLGDPITHGVGGTGFAQNGDPIVGEFHQNPNGYCWANLFRDYLEQSYDCKVINYACTGTKIQFILANFDDLVSKDDDVVICTIGTNNRHKYFSEGEKPSREEHIRLFYGYILELAEKFRQANIPVIFNANIPASEENEKDGANYWRIIHMNEVNELYKKASEECQFPLISLYDSFSNYCEEMQVSVDSLLADGLHPNDEGHEVIFRLMLKELELV